MENILSGSGGVTDASDNKPFKVAVIGGGPGGLFTAWHLAARAGLSCEATVFEADTRLGGKIKTCQFAGVGPYEAGAAEIYDYSRLGPDPLHDLIVRKLGLPIKYISGGPCVIDGKIMVETEDLAKPFGERARDEALSFRKRCADLLNPEDYYLSVAEEDNAHPWLKIPGDALLEREFTDDVARRYIRAMAHSDVAADPHHANGLTFLKNVLMDVDGYMDIFAVVGGNEQIMTRLAEELDAEIRLNANVTAVEPLADGAYRLEMQVNGHEETVTADYVVVALPLTALSSIHWRSEALEIAMDKHVGYFDRPGHYIRVTLLFKRPFWREHIATDWWMLDAFDGCCVYDEGTRYDYGDYGLLAFLIAGNAALSLANVADERIEQLCLDALPSELALGKELLLDRRIHRWVGSVSAIPGGMPVRPRGINHRPEPVGAPRLVMVGDYMFDATINGVMDSAEVATDIIVADVLKRRRQQSQSDSLRGDLSADALNAALEHVEELMSVQSVMDILKATWGLERGAKLLHVGSGAGSMVAALRALGFDATGVRMQSRGAPRDPRRDRRAQPLLRFRPPTFRERAVRRRHRDGALPNAAGQFGKCDLGASSRDEEWRSSRIRDDGPRDRCHRTLRPASGCASPVLTLGLGGKALCCGVRARAVRPFASRRSVGKGAGARGRAQPVVRRLRKPALLRLRTGVEASLAKARGDARSRREGREFTARRALLIGDGISTGGKQMGCK